MAASKAMKNMKAMKVAKAITPMKAMKAMKAVKATKAKAPAAAMKAKKENPIWQLPPGTILFPDHKLWKHALKASSALWWIRAAALWVAHCLCIRKEMRICRCLCMRLDVHISSCRTCNCTNSIPGLRHAWSAKFTALVWKSLDDPTSCSEHVDVTSCVFFFLLNSCEPAMLR